MATREAIIAALFELCIGVHDFRTTSRKLRLWAEVPKNERPALFLVEHSEFHGRQSESLAKLELTASLFIYTDPGRAGVSGGVELNTILDSLAATLRPAGADAFIAGRQTLGGLVSHAYIDGEVIKDPGDLDGDGMLIVPIKILLP